MRGYLLRDAEKEALLRLRRSPVVAIVGPRQCGKTTLAKKVLSRLPKSLYVDLERPSDAAKLTDPEAFFALHADETVCLDEIQRVPDLFPVLRSVVDAQARNGQMLVLGSASPDLLRQSSETLAGRVTFLELTPFLLPELAGAGIDEALATTWLRGGFPRSLLAATDEESFAWREDFVRTFLERDVRNLRARVDVPRLARLWRMCAHEHGQPLNSARLGAALGTSPHSVRSWLELLEGTFMLRLLPPPLRFIVVGCCAAAVHWGVVRLLVEAGWLRPLAANVLGWMIAFGVSFAGHALWTFAEHGAPWRQALPR